MAGLKNRAQFKAAMDAQGLSADERVKALTEYEEVRSVLEREQVPLPQEGFLERAMGTARGIQRDVFEEPAAGMSSIAEMHLQNLGLPPKAASVGGMLAGDVWRFAPTIPLVAGALALGPEAGAAGAAGAAMKYGPRAMAALKRMGLVGGAFGGYEAGTEALEQQQGEKPYDPAAVAERGVAGTAMGAVGHGVLGEALPFAARAAGGALKSAVAPVRSGVEAALSRIRPAPRTPINAPTRADLQVPKGFKPDIGEVPPSLEQLGRAPLPEGAPAPVPGTRPLEGRLTEAYPPPPPVAPVEPVIPPRIAPGDRSGLGPAERVGPEQFRRMQEGVYDPNELPVPTRPPPGEPMPLDRPLPPDLTELPSGPTIYAEGPPAPPAPSITERLGRVMRQEQPRPVQTREFGRLGEPLESRTIMPGQEPQPLPPGFLERMLEAPEGGLGRPLEGGAFEGAPVPISGRLLPPPRRGVPAPGEQAEAALLRERDLLGPYVPPSRRPTKPLPPQAQGVAAESAPTVTAEPAPLPPGVTRGKVMPADPFEPMDRPAGKLTFQQFYESRTGQPYDAATVGKTPETAALKAEYEGDFLPIPKSHQQELMQAIAESEYVARTGKNRAGEPVPRGQQESAASQAAEWKQRLKEIQKVEGKEIPPPKPAKPVTPRVHAPTREELKAAGERMAALEKAKPPALSALERIRSQEAQGAPLKPAAPKETPEAVPTAPKPPAEPTVREPGRTMSDAEITAVLKPGHGTTFTDPMIFDRDRHLYNPKYSAGAAKLSTRLATDVADQDPTSILEWGTVEGPHETRVPMSWARNGDTIYDPLDGRWVGEDLFELRRKPKMERSFTREQATQFLQETGEKPTPAMVQKYMGSKPAVKAGAYAVKGKTGKETTYHTGEDKRAVKARYKLVEADEPIISHSTDFAENPRFPQAAQPRDRSEIGAREFVDKKIGKELNPAELGQSANAVVGAPVMMPDGVVRSGNGRFLGIRRLIEGKNIYLSKAEQKAKLAEYRQWLKDNADEFGITAADVDAMKNPVLVREDVKALSPKKLAELATFENTPQSAQLSIEDQAIADTARMTPDIILKLADTLGDNPLAKEANIEFAKAFVNAMPATERGTLMDKSGQFTQPALRRAANMLFVEAYGGDNPRAIKPILERVMSATDGDVKGLVNGLLRAAPSIAKLKAKAKAGEMWGDLDISDDIVSSLGVVESMKAKKTTLEQWLKHEDLLHPISDEQRVLVEVFNQVRNSPRQLAELLEHYVEIANKQPGMGETQGLFGKIEPPSRADMLRMAHKIRNLDLKPDQAAAEVQLEKARNAAAQDFLDQAKMHEARGDYEYAKTLRFHAELVRMGKPIPRGGVELTKEEIEAQMKGLFGKAGVNLDDTSIKELAKDYSYAFWAKVATPDFAFRKHPGFLGAVRIIQLHMDKGGRLKRVFLENVPAKQQAFLKGKPLEGMTKKQRRLAAQVTRPGFEWVMRNLPHKQREKFIEAAVRADAEGPLFEPSNATLKSWGLDDVGIERLRQYHNLMQDFKDRVINPLLRSMGREPIEGRAGFFPHKWLGQWEIQTLDGKPVITPQGSTFNTERDVYVMAEKLLKSRPDEQFKVVPSYRQMQAMQELPGDAESRAFDRMMKMLEKEDTVASDELVEAMRKQISARGFPAHIMQRRGAKGYNVEDFEKVVHSYLSQGSRWAPMRKARDLIERIVTGEGRDQAKLPPEVWELVKDLPQIRIDRFKNPRAYAAFDQFMKDVFGQPRVTERAIDDVMKAVPGIRRFLGDRPYRNTVRHARAVEAHLKLGLFNPGFAIVNASQFVSHATPVLGPKWAAKGYWAALQAHWNPGGEAAKILRRYQKLGAIDPFFIEAEAGTSMRHRLNRISFFAGTMAERQNRAATLLGAHYRLQAKGAKGDRLVRMATDWAQDKIDPLNKRILEATAMRVSELLNFRYDVAGRPSMFRGATGEAVGQFRMFGVSTVQLWRRLGELAGKGDPLPLAGHAATLFALSGILGSPLFRTIDSIYRAINPDGLSPADKLLEQDLPQWALRGTPALARVDMSRRLGYGDLLPENIPDLLGPVAGTITDTFTRLARRDFDGIFRDTATGPGDWLYPLLADDEKKGVLEANARKRMRYAPTAWDQRVRSFGFRPLIEAEMADTERLRQRKTEKYKRDRAHYIDLAVEAVRDLRGTDRGEAMRKIYIDARENKTPITPKDVQQEFYKKQTPQVMRQPKLVPKALRKEYVTRTAPQREEQARRLEALRRTQQP